MSRASPANRADLSHENIYFATTERFIYLDGKLSCCLREASHIDFVDEKRHMDVGG